MVATCNARAMSLSTSPEEHLWTTHRSWCNDSKPSHFAAPLPNLLKLGSLTLTSVIELPRRVCTHSHLELNAVSIATVRPQSATPTLNNELLRAECGPGLLPGEFERGLVMGLKEGCQRGGERDSLGLVSPGRGLMVTSPDTIEATRTWNAQQEKGET